MGLVIYPRRLWPLAFDQLWSLQELAHRISTQWESAMFKAIHRRLFKGAVMSEFHRLYGLNLRVIGDEMVGPGTLDDLLNLQYEETGGNAVQTAKNTAEVLESSFGVDVTGMTSRARYERLRNSD